MQNRLRLVLVAFVLCGTAIIARLFYWQVVIASELAARASSQHWETKEMLPSRGDIVARDGFPIVTNSQAFELYAILPQIAMPKKEIAEQLTKILSSVRKQASPSASPDEQEDLASILESRLSVADSVWVKLTGKLTEPAKRSIDALGIEGLTWQKTQLRTYPEGSMAAHLLGIVGSDERGSDTGYFGLEGKYNGELTGRRGIMRQEQDASGRPILLGGYDAIPAQHGRTLKTTLDRTMQLLIEERLQDGVTKYGAKGGTVVVMDPTTGGILAMASSPSYDPSSWHRYKEEEFKNPGTVDTYEPGSAFKAIVMAAALAEHVVAPQTKCPSCSGPVTVGGYSIRTWNSKYYPETSIADMLVHSDNVGMVFVGQRLGRERFLRYLDLFGFTKPSGIDVQDEEPPLVRPKRQWRDIDLATASFGQGIAVNTIQMVRAFAALANQGKLPLAHVVSAIIEEDKIIEIPHGHKQVIKPEIARIITEMLVTAVDQGEARWAKPKGYRIAGKTGTAQIPIAGHYDPKKTIASFVGYAPADNPKFVMLVKLNEPASSPWGSETAAPLFFDIARDFFSYLGIPPEL